MFRQAIYDNTKNKLLNFLGNGGIVKKIVTGIGLSILLLSGIQCSNGSSAGSSTPDPGVPVKTVILEPRLFEEYIRITGTLKARNRIEVVAEEGGILEEILKDKGAYVNSGDTLALLENKVLEAQYNEARAILNQAELDLKSKNTLYGQKAISENEYLTSKYAWERARAAADLMKARFDKLFITSHAAGHVNERWFDRGAYLMPMSRLFEIVDKSTLKINAGVAERFLRDIKIGSPVEITFDAFTEERVRSKISFVSHSIDLDSRTFQVEVEVPNPEGKFAPRMIANMKILRKALKDQIVIPSDSFMESEEGRYVFTKSEDKAKLVKINVVSVYENEILVEGLDPGQELIVLGHQELSDGDLIYTVDY